MADLELEALADAIAQRALARLRAERVGREEPCTPSARAMDSSGAAHECNDGGCDPCTNQNGCGPRLAVTQLGAARVGFSLDERHTSKDIARFIDHTLLKPDATMDEVVKLCVEAKKYGFATVCLNSANIGVAAKLLQGSGVKPIAVVGFPLGAGTTGAKSYETREAVSCGAQEIDMVLNIGALKSRDYAYVEEDIAAVVRAAAPRPVKVILETSMLNTEEKTIACALAKSAGAAFVKTSTGFGGGGATAEDIALMRRIVGPDMGVKASGGIRSTEDAEKMLAAGASRLGASASVAIVTGQKSNAKY